ncbi:MAG: NlpC/P60 family protein [Granulosicoccus sp.]
MTEPHPDAGATSSTSTHEASKIRAASADQQGYIVIAPIATVLEEPHCAAQCVTEALYGEQLDVIEHHEDWLSVILKRDSYRGFIKSTQIAPRPTGQEHSTASSHWVSVRSTLLFSEASEKSQVILRIPFGSELPLQSSTNNSFSKTACGHYVWTDHCLGIKQHYPADPITLATSHFLGAPYRWGGRSPQGTDCSGLVQALARSQGIDIPRDSADQERYIAQQVPMESRRSFDLVYWPGHTGILLSAEKLLHATAFSMDCRIELLDAVLERAGPPSSVRRLFDVSQSR